MLINDRQHLFASCLLVKKREGRVREGTEKWRGTLDAWVAIFIFGKFVLLFYVFLAFLKGNKFVFFLAPNSGEQRKDLFAQFKHKKVKSTLD